jgi:hypothetical protein
MLSMPTLAFRCFLPRGGDANLLRYTSSSRHRSILAYMKSSRHEEEEQKEAVVS